MIWQGPTGATPRPLVSCLMVTQLSRFERARVAVQCFVDQSYAPRELVIVTDHAPSGWDLVNLAGHLPVVLVDDARPHTLGHLRNVSLEAAHGELVAQWDDDDWYHAARLERQIERLQSAHADLCLLARKTLRWEGRVQGISHHLQHGWPGTIVARRDKMLPYPGLARGEDSVQIRKSMRAGARRVLLDAPELFHYVVHGGNTWDKGHMEHIFKASGLL